MALTLVWTRGDDECARPAEPKARPEAAETSAAAVRAEAERRVKATGHDWMLVREQLTGRPVPSETRYLCMQIRFVGDSIARLSPIPADFRSDRYWPKA